MRISEKVGSKEIGLEKFSPVPRSFSHRVVDMRTRYSLRACGLDERHDVMTNRAVEKGFEVSGYTNRARGLFLGQGKGSPERRRGLLID